MTTLLVLSPPLYGLACGKDASNAEKSCQIAEKFLFFLGHYNLTSSILKIVSLISLLRASFMNVSLPRESRTHPQCTRKRKYPLCFLLSVGVWVLLQNAFSLVVVAQPGNPKPSDYHLSITVHQFLVEISKANLFSR